MRPFFTILLSLIGACPSWAISLHPEYYSFMALEVESPLDPSRTDTEYDSDFLTFQLGRPEYLLYQGNRNAMSTSVGSLSSKEFLVQTQAKLQYDFGEKGYFRFLYLEDQNYEIQQQSIIFELGYLFPMIQHGVYLFGSPRYAKRENDIGLGYLWRPSTGQELRIYVLRADFSRNERTRDDDQLIREPSFFGFSYVNSPSTEAWFRLNFRFMTPLIWLSSEQATQVEKKNIYFQLENYFSSATASGFFRIESDRELNSFNGEYVERRRVQPQFEYERSNIAVGVMGVYRNWLLPESHYEGTVILPYMWYRFPAQGWSHWRLGYGLSSGDYSGDYIEKPQSRVDHRGNIEWHILREDKGSIKILFSFDLDRFGSGETWEGGNAQASFVF